MKKISIICAIISIPLILSGIILGFIGYYDFFRTLNTESSDMLVCAFYGIPLLTLGVVCSFIGFMHKREIKVTVEHFGEHPENPQQCCSSIDIKTTKLENYICSTCGQSIDHDSLFCKFCGSKIQNKD